MADALLWLTASDGTAFTNPLFQPTLGHKYAAVRAFTESKDVCYTAIQSVIAKSVAFARESARENPQALPHDAFIAFPVIVIDSPLYLASFNEDAKEMELEGVSAAQLQWRGSPDWFAPVIIDIVTIQHLPDFMRERVSQLEDLSETLLRWGQSVEDAYFKPKEVSSTIYDMLTKPNKFMRQKITLLGSHLLQNSAYTI